MMPNTDEIHQLKLSFELAISNLRNDLHNLNESLAKLAILVASQASTIRTFEDERQRKIGSQSAIKFVWGIFVLGIGAIAYSLHDMVQFLWPPKGH